MPPESNLSILNNSYKDDENEQSGDSYSEDYNNSYLSYNQLEPEINNENKDQENVGIETMNVSAESEEIEGASGCTYSLASNFNPNAAFDDGSCTFDNVTTTADNLQGYSGRGPYSIKCEYSYLQTV